MRIKIPAALQQMFFYGLGLILMKGISLLMLPVFTHYLSTAEFGQLEVLLALINIGTLLLGLGLVDALYRFAGVSHTPEERNQVAGTLFGQTLIIAILGVLVLLPFSAHIAALLPGVVSVSAVRWALISIALEGVIGIPLAWIRMKGMARFFFLCTAGRVVIQAFLIWVFLRSGYGVEGVIMVGALASLGQAILMGGWQWRDTGSHFRLQNSTQYLRYGFPILISGLAGFAVAGLDRWWLAGSAGETELAYYAVAAKFALAAGLVLQPFALWWYPKRFQLLGDAKGLQQNADFAEFGASCGYLLAGAVGVIAPYLIMKLTPAAYHPAIQLVPWLVAAMAFKTQSELMNVGCYSQSDSKIQMNIHLASSAVGVIGYAILIPFFGVFGVIISQLLVNILRAGLFFYCSQRLLSLPYRGYGVISSALLMGIALWIGQWWVAQHPIL
ncbi:MAG: lipopolysaccharide biosynthesis protein [Plesiomonas sp.]|uniref:lipopolysaccharide biosynthesis protein n=1 Tax=Plesiomonas sp. TaxID=2486279 RepID=UPI003EE43E22